MVAPTMSLVRRGGRNDDNHVRAAGPGFQDRGCSHALAAHYPPRSWKVAVRAATVASHRWLGHRSPERNPVAEQERKPTRLWGGRFESGPAEALTRLSVSVQFDWRLAPYDLLASAAHARVLHQAGLLDEDEAARLLAALDSLSGACRSGEFRPAASDEDVHTALER